MALRSLAPCASSSRSRRPRVSAAAPLQVRIGTRGSMLALRQTEAVVRAIRAAWPSVRCDVLPITTTGDRDLDRPIPAFGGKGVFTAEIEAALARGEIQLAVHSLKDLPTAKRPGLAIGAILRREDWADALVARGARGFASLPQGARVGTSSLRRAAQLRAARPDLQVESIRGNVETRLRKLDEGLFEAVVLALAGLRRVGLEARVTEPLPAEVMLPAPGQGALAVQCRDDDEAAARLLAPIDDAPTRAAVTAERAFLASLEAGCSAPVAALAEVRDGRLEIQGLLATGDGSAVWRVSGSGDPEEPVELGTRLAREARELERGAGAAALRRG
jgi:hydroxymethylbilane synthase